MAMAIDVLPDTWPRTQTFSKTAESHSLLIPIGPYQNGNATSLYVDGHLEQAAFRIDSDAPTLKIMDEILSVAQSQGYAVLFRCHDRVCGGFDFRAGLEVVPAPSMYVDLGDFRYLTAERQGDEAETYLSILVSRSRNAAYAQIIRMNGSHRRRPSGLLLTVEPATEQPLSLTEQLESVGYVVLDSLEFASGSPELSSNDYQELARLAAYLATNPAARIALVGHTDTTGTLAGNIELSQQRAQSVLDRLVSAHNVDIDRVSAEGIGYLSPRSNNSSAEGKAHNRRVEAVLIPGG